MGRFVFTHRTDIPGEGNAYIYLENTGEQEIVVEYTKANAEGELDLDIYENPTQDTEGTDLTLNDKNGTDDFIDAKIQGGGSYTTSDAILEYFIPGGSGGQRQGRTDVEDELITISPGESYLFKFLELNNNVTRFSLSGHLREE